MDVLMEGRMEDRSIRSERLVVDTDDVEILSIWR